MKREKITVQLDAVRKYRNAQEYRTVNRARIGDIEEIGDGRVVLKALKRVSENGARSDALVEVLRGDTTCFKLRTLKSWTTPGENPVRRGVRGFA